MSRIGGDGIGDGHTRIREDGGGKYGTPGAGVIIYLAPEIGPADTAGRFNGRTMLELTKTKTKHQLGDFFFHLSFFLRLAAGPSRSPSLSAPRVKEEDRRGAYTPIRGPTYVLFRLCPPLPRYQAPFLAAFTYPLLLSSPPAFSPRSCFFPRAFFFETLSPSVQTVRALWRTGSRALSQIMANKLPKEIAGTTANRSPRFSPWLNRISRRIPLRFIESPVQFYGIRKTSFLISSQ